MRPQAAIKLVSASYFTPFLPLDDIYVTGVLRHRLDMELKLINSNSAILEWMLHCPFLGVFYYALVQDLAYQRGYWPWGMLKELICVTLEHYFNWDGCSAKAS